MLRMVSTGAAGLTAYQAMVDNTAHNLANINTTAFKRRQTNFGDLLYAEDYPKGTPLSVDSSSAPAQIGKGMGLISVTSNFIQGPAQETGISLDLMIEGAGFFAVQMPSGELAYTRSGSFHMDSEGFLVTGEGYRLWPQLVLPEDYQEVTILPEGQLLVSNRDEERPWELDRLQLTRFLNDNRLQPVGKNLYLPTPASGNPETGFPGEEGWGKVRQGFLEASNVGSDRELVNLLLAQRAYSLNARTVQTADEMWAGANHLRR